jgi:hypothetical protein
MQDIHTTLKESLKEAMKARDTVKLDVIRGLLTAFTNELVATGHTPQEMLGDDDATKVIRRIIKQREDSISQFTAAGRQDLADEDTAQLHILQSYVPALAGPDEVKIVAEKIKMQMGDIDKSKMGMLIGAIKKEMGDRADGNVIKGVVEGMF